MYIAYIGLLSFSFNSDLSALKVFSNKCFVHVHFKETNFIFLVEYLM